VVGLSGHEGSVLQYIFYDPFGNKMMNTGVANNNSLHFTGREEDPDTGLYYYRARYYDPMIGRFLTEDPKGFMAGVNFYTYAQNNPINANDPSGKIAILDNAVGGVINVGIGYGISRLTGHDYGWGQAALDFGIGFATNGISSIVQVRRLAQIAELSTVAKGALGAELATEQIVSRGETIVAEEVTVATRVAKPRVDFVVEDAAGTLKGVEAKLGPSADFTPAQRAGYDYINSGGTGTLTGSNAADALIKGETISEVETMQFYQSGYNPTMADTLPLAVGLDAGYQTLSSTPAAAGGFVIYPNKSNLNMMKSVYSK
jgi:RHS repeat-associated protein